MFGSPRRLTLSQGGGVPTPSPSTAALSSLASKSQSTGAYAFTVSRSGDTSSSKTVGYSVAGSSLNGATPALASDFGGTFPTGSVTFAPGETSKTISVTPTTNVEPE